MPDQKVCAGLLYAQTHSAIMRTENGDKSNNYCLCSFVYRISPSVSDNCRSLPMGVTCYFFFSFTADQNNHSRFSCPGLMDLVQENTMADDCEFRQKSLEKLDCSEQEAENTNESSPEDSWQCTHQSRCDDSEIFQGTNINF